MGKDFAHFLSPLTIRGKTWKNRSVAAPMGLIGIENGRLTEHAKYFIDFYTQGDLAEFIVGETDVNREGSRAPGGNYFEMRDPENMRGLRECAERVHANGALALLELSHCGASKMAGPDTRLVGPMSFVRESDGAVVHGMTEEDIARTVDDFASGARVLKDCGFDGALIHAGHGWLPHQFLSPRTNQRQDRFGGSVENRARFLTMIMDAVRASCGEDFIIECRLSGSENVDDGYSLDDICKTCEILSRHCDIIHVSAGLYYNPVDTLMISSMYDAHGCNLPVAAEIKKHVNISVAVVGGFTDPALCEKAVAEGQADLIVMGRQRLADPQFVTKCREGRADEIRRCIRCMRCFPGPAEHVTAELSQMGCKGDPMREIMEIISRCTINPQFKLGPLDKQPPAERSKKVLIVGGGCAGMQAAITATERGHKVTLIEKTGKLGGKLNFGEEDPIKGELADLAKSMSAEMKRQNVEVRLNTAFSKELLAQLKPDAVIAAVGSKQSTKNTPGIDSPHVLSAMDCYKKGMDFGKRAVVIGGGQIGCETSVHIAQAGCQVTLIVKYDKPCRNAFRLHRLKLQSLLEKLQCRVMKNTVCTEVLKNGIKTRDSEGREEFIEADCIINALGMEAAPFADVEQACEGLEFYSIGDCVKARNICDALEEGYLAAIRL
ncbi:MAG: FAD-dependent oxidoreductase [Oscillospiraceae bacterium]